MMGSEILSLGVAQLREELKKRNIAIPPRALKAQMVKLLKEAVKNSILKK